MLPHVLTDITSRRTICATKFRTAKVFSTNIRMLASIVMNYAPHARKVLLIMQNEELILLNQNAIYVSEQRNLSTMVCVGALLIKNQLTLLVIKHLEKLLQPEMT